MSNNENSKYLNVNHVAAEFNVNPKTVFRWCSAGELPHIKIGGSLRFKQSDLLALLEKKIV